MIKIRLVALLLLAFTLVNHSATAQSEQSITDKVDQLFAKWNKPDSPGCALGVIKDGKIIYKRGYGMANLDHSIPISPTTVFYIASTSKQFTAASVALLARQGKLSLDDDIRKYLPEMPQYESLITLRHLIHHTSGIRDYLELMRFAGMPHENIYTDQELIDLIARQKRLNFKPGDQFLYSNSGYFLLSQIVKRASGQSLRQFAEENIFKPLGMKNTHFHDDRTMVVKNRATGYSPKAGGFSIVLTNFDKVGDGGLLTTVEDLYLWNQNFYENKLGGGADLLNQLLTPGALNSGEKLSYAFGLLPDQYKGLRIILHGGSFLGFRAEMVRFPEQRFSVICLCNLGNIDPSTLALRVADIYLADQLKLETLNASKEVAAEPTPVKVSEQELTGKVGQYYDKENKTIRRVYLYDGKLMSTRVLGSAGELVPMGENRFRLLGTSVKTEVIFQSPREGVPMEMQILLAGGKSSRLQAFQPASPTGAELADYAGDYYSAELGAAYKFLSKEGGLYLRVKNMPEVKLSPTIKDEFRFGDWIISFVRNTQNRVSGFTLDGDRVKNISFEK